jgi:hypothetical protein
MDILAALKHEEAKLKHRLTGIQSAIAALSGTFRAKISGKSKGGAPKRVVSAALRAHLSRKAKERWAKIHAAKGKGGK